MLVTLTRVEEGCYCDGCWTRHCPKAVPLIAFQPSLGAFDPEKEDVVLCADCLREMLRILEESKG